MTRRIIRTDPHTLAGATFTKIGDPSRIRRVRFGAVRDIHTTWGILDYCRYLRVSAERGLLRDVVVLDTTGTPVDLADIEEPGPPPTYTVTFADVAGRWHERVVEDWDMARVARGLARAASTGHASGIAVRDQAGTDRIAEIPALRT